MILSPGNWGSHVNSWTSKAEFLPTFHSCSFYFQLTAHGSERAREFDPSGGVVSDRKLCRVPLETSCNFLDWQLNLALQMDTEGGEGTEIEKEL